MGAASERRRAPSWARLGVVVAVVASALVVTQAEGAGAAIGPYDFAVAARAGEGGRCTYSAGALRKINVASPRAQMRAFWRTAQGGHWGAQAVGYYERLYGLRSGGWVRIAKSKTVGIQATAQWKRLPDLPGFAPKAGYTRYRVVETLLWRRPAATIRGQRIEGTKSITLRKYSDGKAWRSWCPRAPQPVSGLASVVTDATATVSWRKPPSATRAVVRWAKGTKAPAKVTSGHRAKLTSSRTTRLKSLAPATKYAVAIWVRDKFGHYSKRRVTHVVTRALPGPVTDLVVTPTVTRAAPSLTLQWQNPPANFGGVKICRATGSTPPTRRSCAARKNLAAGVSSWVDTGVATGTQYQYAVFARSLSHTRVVAADTGGATTYTFPEIDGPDTLPDARVAVDYGTTTFTADRDVTWSVVAGVLPDGVVLDGAAGTLTGTPAVPASGDPENVTITVRATDESTGLVSDRSYSFTLGFAAGDVDGDGAKTCADASVIASNMGATTATHVMGDLVAPEGVDSDDLTFWNGDGEVVSCP